MLCGAVRRVSSVGRLLLLHHGELAAHGGGAVVFRHPLFRHPQPSTLPNLSSRRPQITFGELPAFIALASLLLEYVLGMAATAQGFSRYLAKLLNLDKDIFVLEIGGEGCSADYRLDFMAAAIVMLMSVLLSLGVRESAYFISSEKPQPVDAAAGTCR